MAVVSIVVERIKFINDKLVSVEGSSVADVAGVLKEKESCLIFVRVSDQVTQLRRAFRRPDTDPRTSGWISCADDEVTICLMCCRILVKTALERNRKGRKLLECTEILEVHKDMDPNELTEKIAAIANSGDSEVTTTNLRHDKSIRHVLFAKWLVKKFGRERLANGSGVLDVAGGKGELGVALHQLGIPSILLDPLPRPESSSPPFSIIRQPLIGDGRKLMNGDDTAKLLLLNCSIITGMHPDEATEAIVDTAMQLGKPFAILPCCVLPNLFPHRMQKQHNQPVRSHSTFCQYLLDKAPKGCRFLVDYLPFDGRNQIIYFDFLCMNTEIAS